MSPTAVAKTEVLNAADNTPIVDSKKTGSATGATHTLRQRGLYTKLVNTDAREPERGEAVFELTIELTAFDTDAFIRKVAHREEAISNRAHNGFSYVIEDPEGVVSFGEDKAELKASETTVYQGSGSPAFRIPEAESRKLTLQVNFRLDDEHADYYRLDLRFLEWATSEAAVDANRWQSLHLQQAETDYAVLP